MTVQENAVYGKVPCFIRVCEEGKSERMSLRLTTPSKSSRTSEQTISDSQEMREVIEVSVAGRNAVERRMSESRVRENLTHGLMRGGRKSTRLLYPAPTHGSRSPLFLN